jgi:hypothetical protein
MIPRRYRLSPTAFINRANPTSERGYYKRPRKTLNRSSTRADEKPGEVIVRYPHKGETIDTHIHPHKLGERMLIFASKEDLQDTRGKGKKDLRTWTIANKYKGRTVGYTVLHPTRKGPIRPAYRAADQLLKSPQTKPRTQFRKEFTTAVRTMNDAGIHVRFVPNSKEGYIYSQGRFVKARSQRQLAAGKKGRVSFLATPKAKN